MMRKMKLVAVAALALVGATSASEAAVVYSTDFNTPTYTSGALIGQDGWLITGTSVVNPLSVSGGSVSLTTTGQDANRPFTPTITSGSAFLGVDANVTAAQATGDYFIHLGDGGTTNFYARVYARSATGGYVLGLATSSGTVTYGTTVVPFGTSRIVAQYNFVAGAANDTASLFVNGTSYGPGTTIGTDATTISSLNLRQGSASNAPTVNVDNIVVSTDFDSANAAVPEPTSLGLLGAAGLMALRRRRA